MGKIIGYHGYVDEQGRGFIVNNENDIWWYSINEQNLLYWLIKDHDGDEYKKVAYDIDALTAIILKLVGITEEQAKTLNDTERVRIGEFEITYYPSKFLGIGQGRGLSRPYASFTDVGQYYDNPTLNFSHTVDNCRKIAQEARDVAAGVSKSLHELGLEAVSLTSPIKALEKSMMANLDLPNHLDVPPEVNDLALKCCAGNLVQVYAQGHFENCLDLDISGAYSYFLGNLLDTRRGEWLSGKRPENAVYVFAHGVISTDAPLHPFIYGNGEENGNYTPVGSWETSLTLQEIDFLREYQLGEFEITGEQYWWTPTGKYVDGKLVTRHQNQPLRGTVNWIFGKRQNATPMQNKLLKRMASGLWGRTLSKYKGKYAETFMPVWGSVVEVSTRIETVKYCLENAIMPLSIAVDGIVTDGKVRIPTEKGLGKWRVSHTGNCLIVGSGTVAMEHKAGQGDFGIEYEWLYNKIINSPDKTEYSMEKVICNTLGRAMNLDFNQLGSLEMSNKTIRIGQETKRFYWFNPTTGGDLLENKYHSEPLNVALLV